MELVVMTVVVLVLVALPVVVESFPPALLLRLCGWSMLGGVFALPCGGASCVFSFFFNQIPRQPCGPLAGRMRSVARTGDVRPNDNEISC